MIWVWREIYKSPGQNKKSLFMMIKNGYHTGLCGAAQIHPPHISSPTWFFYDSLSQFSILNGIYQIDFQFQKRFSFSSLLFHKIIFNSKKEKDFQFSFLILLFTHGLAACYNNITERGKVIVSIPIFFLLLDRQYKLFDS